MELDKSLAALAALEKLYCLEKNLNEAPIYKHPLSSAVGQKKSNQKSKDRKKSQKYLNKKDDAALRIDFSRLNAKNFAKEKKSSFFRLVLEKLENEFPKMKNVEEWREV